MCLSACLSVHEACIVPQCHVWPLSQVPPHQELPRPCSVCGVCIEPSFGNICWHSFQKIYWGKKVKFNVRSAKSEMIILVAKIVYLFFGFFLGGGKGLNMGEVIC